MRTTNATTSTSARTLQPRNAMVRGLSVLLACCLAFAGMTFGFGGGQAHADAPAHASAGADPTDQEMKPEATFSGIAAENAVFDNTSHAGYTGTPLAHYDTPDGTQKQYTGGFEISYQDKEDGRVSKEWPVNAGTYTVWFVVPANAECRGQTSLEFTIAKANAPAPLKAQKALMLDMAGYEKNVSIGRVIEHQLKNFGKATFAITSSTYTGLSAVSTSFFDEKATLDLVSNGNGRNATDTITIDIKDIDNYHDTSITYTITYRDKPTTTNEIQDVTAETGLVYNGTPQMGYAGAPYMRYTPYDLTADRMYSGPFDIAYTGTSANGSAYGPTAQAPTNAGTYQVTLAVPESAEFFGPSKAVEFSIAKAPLVFRAQDASMTAGGAVPAFAYQVEGLKGADRVTQEPRLTVEGDTTKAGSCTIAVSGGAVDNQASYDVSYENATLKVSAAPVVPDPVVPDPDQPAPPADKPEPAKPTPLPTKGAPAGSSAVLASTGDTALPGLVAVAAGIAALAAGIALARIRASHRRS